MYVHKQFIRQVNVTVTCRLTRHHGTMGESERPLGKPKALELLLPYEHDEYSWEVFDEKKKTRSYRETIIRTNVTRRLHYRASS